MSATDSTFRPTLLLMSGRGLAFVVTFLTPVVLSRVFDQTEFGTYKQLFLVFSTVYTIAQFGMAESLFYFLPMAGDAAGRYVANSLLFLVTAGALSVVGLEAASGDIAHWFHNSALSADLPLFAVFLGLMLAAAGLEIVMTARGRYLTASASYGISDVVRAVCLVLPAVLVHRLDALLAGAVAFGLLRAAAALGYFARTFRSTLRFDRTLVARQLGYAGPFGLAVVLHNVHTNLPQYVVSYRFDPATFAVYAVGCLQIPLVDLVLASAGSVLMVQMVEAVRRARPERALEIWRDVIRKLALLFFPLVGLLVVAAPELIVKLFTEQYRASIPVFVISTAVIALSVLPTDSVLRVYAETRFLLLLYGVQLLLIAALITPLIAVFHLPGAMLTTVLAGVVAKCLALARIRRRMGVSLPRFLPWRRLGRTAAAATIAALAGLAAQSLLGISGLEALTVEGLVATGVYLALLVPMGLIDEGELSELGNWRRWLSAGGASRPDTSANGTREGAQRRDRDGSRWEPRPGRPAADLVTTTPPRLDPWSRTKGPR